jgi:hypothetical protein
MHGVIYPIYPRLFAGRTTHGFDGEVSPLSQQEKEALEFDRIKRRAEERHLKKRNGRRKWNTGIGEMVIVEAANQSDALEGVTHKFQRPYDGPYRISRVVTPSIFELVDARGKVRGRYNMRALKKFLGGESLGDSVQGNPQRSSSTGGCGSVP